MSVNPRMAPKGPSSPIGHRLRRLAIIVTATLAAGYVVWGLAGVAAERSLLFPRPTPRDVRVPPGGELLHIPHGKETVLALYLPAAAGFPTLVFFHGNAEQLADLTNMAREIRGNRVGFFAVEYPGYGRSDGIPSQTTLFDAADVGIRYLNTVLHVRREDTIVEGWSLGSGVAAEMASRGFGSRLILVSPYTSIADLGKRVLPYHPTRLLVRDPFDTASKARGILIPTLIIHGSRDDVIPVSMGERLSRLFPHAELHVLDGARHDIADRPSVLRQAVAFATSSRQPSPLSGNHP